MNNTTSIRSTADIRPELDTPAGDSIEAALPNNLKVLLRTAQRVILVANNPAISAKDFENLAIGSQDVVVSFNTCIKSEFLSSEHTNVFVHGYHGQDFYFFGLPGAPVVNPLFQTAQRGCFTVLVGVTLPMSALPDVAIFADRIALPTLQENYPASRKSGKPISGPSTGFNAMVVFEHIRQLPGYRYELLALGFSNEAGKLWGGHAWDYERAWLQQSGVQSIALLKRQRTWRDWFRKPR